jgi:YggT family protein
MHLLGAAIRVYTFVLIARVLFSWLPPASRENEVYRFLLAATEPVLAPLRRILPPAGGLDFSPLVALVVLELIRRGLGG